MKKALFLLFTVISLGCYVIALFFLHAHYTDENAFVAYLLFMQMLAVGLLSGLLSLGIKSFLKIALIGFLAVVHRINSILLLLGSVAFLYYFLTE